jgi:hypothetical protein
VSAGLSRAHEGGSDLLSARVRTPGGADTCAGPSASRLPSETMLRSGIVLDYEIFEGSDVITPMEIDDRLDNLDRRLDRIEQILPGLATKADLLATKADLTEALGEAFERAETNARILHEDLVEKIKRLGENRRKLR